MKLMLLLSLSLCVLCGCASREKLEGIPLGKYEAETGDEYMEVLPGNKIFFHLKNTPDNGKYLDRTHSCRLERSEFKQGDYIRPEGIVSTDRIHGVLQYDYEWADEAIIVENRFRTEKRVFRLSLDAGQLD